MNSNITTPEDYIRHLPPEQKEAFEKLRRILRENLPEGFQEIIQSGMLAFVVPHNLYPPGYHANPSQPLPFVSVASQKNFIALYHMGLYADKHLLDWFIAEYPKHSTKKLDIGKSCIRFKNIKEIPYDLIAKLVAQVTPERWIKTYEQEMKSR